MARLTVLLQNRRDILVKVVCADRLIAALSPITKTNIVRCIVRWIIKVSFRGWEKRLPEDRGLNFR